MARPVAVLVFLPLLSLMAQSQTAPPPAAPTGSGFVGSNTCKTCHADVWQNFYKNPHFKSLASGKEPPERTGCEGCHGPGQAHIAAGGGRDTIGRAFSLLRPKQVLEACLTCHESNFDKANIQRSEHTQHDVACTFLTVRSVRKLRVSKTAPLRMVTPGTTTEDSAWILSSTSPVLLIWGLTSRMTPTSLYSNCVLRPMEPLFWLAVWTGTCCPTKSRPVSLSRILI